MQEKALFLSTSQTNNSNLGKYQLILKLLDFFFF